MRSTHNIMTTHVQIQSTYNGEWHWKGGSCKQAKLPPKPSSSSSSWPACSTALLHQSTSYTLPCAALALLNLNWLKQRLLRSFKCCREGGGRGWGRNNCSGGDTLVPLPWTTSCPLIILIVIGILPSLSYSPQSSSSSDPSFVFKYSVLCVFAIGFERHINYHPQYHHD